MRIVEKLLESCLWLYNPHSHCTLLH